VSEDNLFGLLTLLALAIFAAAIWLGGNWWLDRQERDFHE
jgi:hypothetical protein